MDESVSEELAVASSSQGELQKLARQRLRWLVRLRGLWRRVRWEKIGLFAFSLLLFMLAISLMKEGAHAFAPLFDRGFSLNHPANSLGFGWLFAYLIMSGSPVAASALTFFDAGLIDQLGAFSMIAGSRLGASFIVLLLGLIYVLRGRDKANSLGMGLLSLTVTGTTYLLGLLIGVFILQAGILDPVQIRTGLLLTSLVEFIFDPILHAASALLPLWTVFLVGLGLAMASFALFDRSLPKMTVRQSQVGRVSRLVYRPWVMFALGSAVTLMSMSVSVSLGILVPLSDRGFIRRENVIPYIMGANITTFIDTLFAAVLLNNPPAFTVVLVEMVSIALASSLILALFYQRYVRGSLAFVSWVTASNRNLLVFMFVILAAPFILMLM